MVYVIADNKQDAERLTYAAWLAALGGVADDRAWCPGVSPPDNSCSPANKGDGKQGGSKKSGRKRPERVPTRKPSRRERDLAAGEGSSEERVAARKVVASHFLHSEGAYFNRQTGKLEPLDEQRFRGQMKAIDWTKPVLVGPPPSMPPPAQFVQWQAPGNIPPPGGYYSTPGTTPERLGIGRRGTAWSLEDKPVVEKVPHVFEVEGTRRYIQSTAAPAVDTWSVAGGDAQRAGGGGPQWFVPESQAAGGVKEFKLRGPRRRSARAFCPGASPPDNSCEPANKGTGTTPYRALAAWRKENEKALSALRDSLQSAQSGTDAAVAQSEGKKKRLYGERDALQDAKDDAKDRMKVARKALQDAVVAAAPESEKEQWASVDPWALPSRMNALDEDFTSQWLQTDQIREKLAEFTSAKRAFSESAEMLHSKEGEVVSAHEEHLRVLHSAAVAQWRAIGGFGEQYAASKGMLSKEKQKDLFELYRETFVDQLRAAPVDTSRLDGVGQLAGVKEYWEKTFREETRPKVDEFLSSVVSPVSSAARSVQNATTVLDYDADRAFVSGATIFAGPGAQASTHAHEMGHIIENGNPAILDAAIAFRNSRCDPAIDKPMSEMFPGQGYRSSEVGNPDDFGKVTSAVFGEARLVTRAPVTAAYAGKVYAASTKVRPYATEIVSVGMELMYHSPSEFAAADPEYFDFMVGVVSGSLPRARKKK